MFCLYEIKLWLDSSPDLFGEWIYAGSRAGESFEVLETLAGLLLFGLRNSRIRNKVMRLAFRT